MVSQRQIKSMSELMDGGVEQRFNEAMAEIWRNVQDPNTDPKAKRKMTIEITVKPNERRDSAEFSVAVNTKLAVSMPLSQTVFLQFNSDGSVTATEMTSQIPGQLSFDGTEQPLPKVVRFNTQDN